MKLTSFIIFLGLSVSMVHASTTQESGGEAALKEAMKKNKDTEPSKVDMDSKALEDKYAKDPVLSPESANQAEADKVAEQASDKNQANALRILLSSHSCEKLPTPELGKKCRENMLKKKAKK